MPAARDFQGSLSGLRRSIGRIAMLEARLAARRLLSRGAVEIVGLTLPGCPVICDWATAGSTRAARLFFV
jgi:hypothetical protein